MFSERCASLCSRIAAIFAKLPELLGKRSNDSASEEGGAK
jgi:hypothetical protein